MRSENLYWLQNLELDEGKAPNFSPQPNKFSGRVGEGLAQKQKLPSTSFKSKENNFLI